MNEEKIIVDGLAFFGGALPQPEDKRDFTFASVAPFDWELGFDIELLLGYRQVCKDINEFFGPAGIEGWGVLRYKEIVKEVREKNIPPFLIPIKNQGGSYSCTAQAMSYLVSILNFIETGKWFEVSARDIYAYISLGYGKGAFLRDACARAVDPGAADEELVPSYNYVQTTNGRVRNPMSETEYLIKPEETEAIKNARKLLQGKEYRVIYSGGEQKMDDIAWAMMMNFGAYFAVRGENNGTWAGEYPAPPKTPTWGHAILGGKAGLVNGQKTLGFVNSWGNQIGINGWQKLQKNYFINLPNGQELVFDPWTLTDKITTMTENQFVKIIKDKNSSAVGYWIPATSPDALKTMALAFGKEIVKKADGSIDWDKTIEGELILK